MSPQPISYNGSHFGTFEVRGYGPGLKLAHTDLETARYDVIGSFQEVTTSPLRIKRPAVRRSFLDERPDNRHRRGEEPFVEVGWDDAIALASSHLTRIYSGQGAESVYGGSYGWASAGRFHHAQSQVHRFLNLMGGYTASLNTYSHGAAEVLLPHVVGTEDDIIYRGTTWPVIADHTEVVVAFGGLPVQTGMVSPGGASERTNDDWIRRCAANGVKLVNIGPLRNEYDEIFGSAWITPRPNTDTALMMGLAYELHRNGWHDRAFLERYTAGFARFEAYLTGASDGQRKDPAWAANICGVSVFAIEELARTLHEKRCLLSATFALQRAEYGEHLVHMLVVLAAMLGQIGLPGGGFAFGLTSFNAVAKPIQRLGFGSLPQGRNQVRARVPVACVTEMLENPGTEYHYNGRRATYPDIQAIYWAGGNPFHHHQNLGRLHNAWKKPQLVLCNDIEWNATARHADIVFPVCSTLERNDVMSSKFDPYLVAMKKVHDPVGESRTDFDVFAAFAEHLGWKNVFTEGLDEMGWLRRLYVVGQKEAAKQGLEMPDFDRFWADGIWRRPHEVLRRTLLSTFRQSPEKAPLTTPSGKIEIFSQAIADMGVNDCSGHPEWRAPREWLGAADAGAGKLHLLSPQPRNRLHGQLDGNGASRAAKISGREPIYLNPEDAAVRGIGKKRCRARVQHSGRSPVRCTLM